MNRGRKFIPQDPTPTSWHLSGHQHCPWSPGHRQEVIITVDDDFCLPDLTVENPLAGTGALRGCPDLPVDCQTLANSGPVNRCPGPSSYPPQQQSPATAFLSQVSPSLLPPNSVLRWALEATCPGSVLRQTRSRLQSYSPPSPIPLGTQMLTNMC